MPRFSRAVLALPILAVAMAVLLVSPQKVHAESLRLVMAASYDPGNFHTKGAQRLAELAAKYSGGTLDIRIVPRQDLGLAAKALPGAVGKGEPPLADIFMASAQPLSPVFGLSSLPMLVSTFDQAREMYNLMRPAYEAVCDFWDLRFLYAAPWPPSGIFAQGPVLTAEDLEKQYLRVYDANSADFFQSMGAKAQIMNLGDVPFAHRAGRLDMVLTSSESGMEHRFADLFSHFTRLGYAYPLNMAVIHVLTWLKLDPAQQAALTRAAKEVDTRQWLAAKANDKTATQFLASRGMVLVDPPAETVRAFQAAAVPMIRSFLHETGDDDVRRAWTAWREGRKR